MADGQAGEEAMPGDIRPVIKTGNASNLGLYAFIVLLLLGGVWLFSALNSARLDNENPRSNLARAGAGERISAPAAPQLPSRFTQNQETVRQQAQTRPLGPPPARLVSEPPSSIGTSPAIPIAPSRSFAPQPVFAPEPFATQPLARAQARPEVIFGRAGGSSAPSARETSEENSDRIRASRLSSPAFTVPLGTVIPAVLETALDSTQPGAARALVQRDIYSFDGSRVLIPRGSRLHGDYGGELQRGQNRALIQWTRLIRPDGVTIALDSPSSDPLGRAGVKGKVDSKFLERFGGAILQSVLDLGVGIATREATDGVILALPGSTQNVTQTQPQNVQPTLKIKHGTSVSVYVSRDLDFSSVER